MLRTTRKSIGSQKRMQGFSLMTVTIVGLLATMWLTATTLNMMQVYQVANQQRYSSALLSAAEAGTDFVIAHLNDSATRSTYDAATTPYGSQKTTVLNPSSWGAPIDANISVTVKNIAPTTSSYLFEDQLSPAAESSPTTQGWSVFKAGNNANPWRLLQTTASYNGMQKTITVVLQGVYPARSMNGSTPPSGPSYFTNGALATGQLSLGGGTTTAGYDSTTGVFFTSSTGQPLGGDVASFTSAVLDASSGAVTVGGSLDVPSLNNPGKSVAGSSLPSVNRYLTTNGSQVGFGSTVQGDIINNVMGMTDSVNFPADPTRILNPILTNQSNSQGSLAPAPSAPMNASGQLGSGTVAPTSGSIAISSSPPPVTRADYSVSSFSVSNSSTNVSLGSGSQPVRVFVDGNNGTQPITIQGNVNAGNGRSPADFQIWYNGTGTIEIRSSEMRGTVYAPNATVLMGTKTSLETPVSFYGSVVAKQIGGDIDSSGNLKPTRNLNFYADRALSNPSEFSGAGSQNKQSSLTFDAADYSGNPKFFQVVSYTEARQNH